MKNESVFQFSPDSPAGDLVGLLTRAGYSNTRARRAVLEALSMAESPLSPADLLESAQARHQALSLVTVYRTLEILEGIGLVRKVHLAEGCHSYVLSNTGNRANAAHGGHGPDGHGHHVICQACHRAVEFAGCDVDAVILAVQAQTGYVVQSHWLEMFGLCPSCQEKQ